MIPDVTVIVIEGTRLVIYIKILLTTYNFFLIFAVKLN
jgi:hypothetical protein